MLITDSDYTMLNKLYSKQYSKAHDIFNNRRLQVKRSTRFLYSNTNEFHNLHNMLMENTKLQNPSRTRSQLKMIPDKELTDKKN
jgi:uncharacterized cupredoxin-like copper-binding protein